MAMVLLGSNAMYAVRSDEWNPSTLHQQNLVGNSYCTAASQWQLVNGS